MSDVSTLFVSRLDGEYDTDDDDDAFFTSSLTGWPPDD